MSTIPPFQDYDDDDPDIEFRKNRWNYWTALKEIRKEYMQDSTGVDFDAYEFEDYIESKYGIKMNMVDGNITDGYTVMDEKKYLIFLLKYR
jgi:hypothetical protein